MAELNIGNLDTEELGQLAFTAYVDAALWTVEPHQRLEAGSRAAAEVVARKVRDVVVYERTKSERRRAVHGTNGGYHTGCRCQFCRDAKSVYERAYRFHKGANSIKKLTASP